MESVTDVQIRKEMEMTDFKNWNYSVNPVDNSLLEERNQTLATDRSLVSTVMAASLISLIVAIIIFGNLLVIVAVLRNRQLKQAVQNRFILSLAVADLLIGCLIMPLSLHRTLLNYWSLGSIVCDIWLATDVFLCTASTLSLVAITLDRYLSVSRALQYPQLRTSARVNAAICTVWVVSALVSIPPLAGWKSNTSHDVSGKPQCDISDELGYIIYSLTISFYIPLLIILVANVKVCLIARRISQQRIQMGRLTSANTSKPHNERQDNAGVTKADQGNGTNAKVNEESDCSGDKGNSLTATSSDDNSQDKKVAPSTAALLSNDDHIVRRLQQHRKRERRATATITVIVVAFIVCWLPFSVLYLIDKLCSCGIKEDEIFAVIFWMGYCNSAMNPILYAIINRDFRKAFHNLLRSKCK